MNINNRFCVQTGHEQAHANHLCTFEDCKLLQRQCCIQCINEGIHNHGKSDNEHIRLEQEIQKVQQKTLVENHKNIQLIDFSKRKYNIKEIEKQNYGGFHTAHISNNEKYLAYGGSDQMLRIYDLKLFKIIKVIYTNRFIYLCQFSFDSSYLYVGCEYNFGDDEYFKLIIVYDVQKSFKKISQYNLGSHPYGHTIQNQYLITIYQNKIIKTDIKMNKQIFKLKSHDVYTGGIDYNKSYDLIISASKDQSIKLWDCSKRSLIFNQKNPQTSINQIQFINKIQNVLSLDLSGSLYKWRLDLINNKLIKLQKYQYPNMIYSFCSINQNQSLLLVCEHYFKILNNQGRTILQINHSCGSKSNSDFDTMANRQLDNARFIVITTSKKLMLATALE